MLAVDPQEHTLSHKLFFDEFAAAKVRLNNVLPGFIGSLRKKQEFKDRVPMNRYGTSNEVARVIAFLCLGRRGIHHWPKHLRGRRHHAICATAQAHHAERSAGQDDRYRTTNS